MNGGLAWIERRFFSLSLHLSFSSSLCLCDSVANIRNPQSIRVPIDTDHPDEGCRDDGRHSQEFPILLTK
jgi:hypothetical protein